MLEKITPKKITLKKITLNIVEIIVNVIVIRNTDNRHSFVSFKLQYIIM